jgi:hypothetical protein
MIFYMIYEFANGFYYIGTGDFMVSIYEFFRAELF